jgi:hypothetical protein
MRARLCRCGPRSWLPACMVEPRRPRVQTHGRAAGAGQSRAPNRRIAVTLRQMAATGSSRRSRNTGRAWRSGWEPRALRGGRGAAPGQAQRRCGGRAAGEPPGARQVHARAHAGGPRGAAGRVRMRRAARPPRPATSMHAALHSSSVHSSQWGFSTSGMRRAAAACWRVLPLACSTRRSRTSSDSRPSVRPLMRPAPRTRKTTMIAYAASVPGGSCSCPGAIVGGARGSRRSRAYRADRGAAAERAPAGRVHAVPRGAVR